MQNEKVIFPLSNQHLATRRACAFSANCFEEYQHLISRIHYCVKCKMLAFSNSSGAFSKSRSTRVGFYTCIPCHVY